MQGDGRRRRGKGDKTLRQGGQPEKKAERSGSQYRQEDGPGYPAYCQNGRQEQADQAKERRRLKGAELHQDRIVADHQPEILQPDESDEKTDPNRSRHAQGNGDCLRQAFANPEQS